MTVRTTWFCHKTSLPTPFTFSNVAASSVSRHGAVVGGYLCGLGRISLNREHSRRKRCRPTGDGGTKECPHLRLVATQDARTIEMSRSFLPSRLGRQRLFPRLEAETGPAAQGLSRVDATPTLSRASPLDPDLRLEMSERTSYHARSFLVIFHGPNSRICSS